MLDVRLPVRGSELALFCVVSKVGFVEADSSKRFGTVTVRSSLCLNPHPD